MVQERIVVNMIKKMLYIILLLNLCLNVVACDKKTNSIWGTFKASDGSMICIEQDQDFGDDLYTVYITRSENPWITEMAILDDEDNTIGFVDGSSEDELSYELKSKNLILTDLHNSEEKKYKKVSDEADVEAILDADYLKADEIVGVYSLDQSDTAYGLPFDYIQIEKVSDTVVNVYNVKLLIPEYVLYMKAENVDVSEFFSGKSVCLNNEYTGNSDNFYFGGTTTLCAENIYGTYFKVEHEGFDISALAEDFEDPAMENN